MQNPEDVVLSAAVQVSDRPPRATRNKKETTTVEYFWNSFRPRNAGTIRLRRLATGILNRNKLINESSRIYTARKRRSILMILQSSVFKRKPTINNVLFISNTRVGSEQMRTVFCAQSAKPMGIYDFLKPGDHVSIKSYTVSAETSGGGILKENRKKKRKKIELRSRYQTNDSIIINKNMRRTRKTLETRFVSAEWHGRGSWWSEAIVLWNRLKKKYIYIIEKSPRRDLCVKTEEFGAFCKFLISSRKV